MIVNRISYTVEDDRIDENQKAVGAFIAEVAALDGASYTSFQVGDGTAFMHLAIFESEAAKERFFALPGFQPFADSLKQRTKGPPQVDSLTLVASSIGELQR
jgi:quinol monooxygenase YgiN